MVEFDFSTQEGKDNAKAYIKDIIDNNKKEELSELLYAMMEFIVNHEINFDNLKNSLN